MASNVNLEGPICFPPGGQIEEPKKLEARLEFLSVKKVVVHRLQKGFLVTHNDMIGMTEHRNFAVSTLREVKTLLDEWAKNGPSKE